MRPITLRARLVLVTLGPLMLAAVFATEAMACPFCDGGSSGVNEVREGIFDGNFWPRVAATLAPFPIFAGIVALIYFGPPCFERGRSEATKCASRVSCPQAD
ncbi:MAG: hypothetical protein SH850_16240 [Planctomycetaceae bacterium]|nr:hypothetical protein [Planctomycetaceae bacterium]